MNVSLNATLSLRDWSFQPLLYLFFSGNEFPRIFENVFHMTAFIIRHFPANSLHLFFYLVQLRWESHCQGQRELQWEQSEMRPVWKHYIMYLWKRGQKHIIHRVQLFHDDTYVNSDINAIQPNKQATKRYGENLEVTLLFFSSCLYEACCHSARQSATAGREKSKSGHSVKLPREVNNLGNSGRPGLIRGPPFWLPGGS